MGAPDSEEVGSIGGVSALIEFNSGLINLRPINMKEWELRNRERYRGTSLTSKRTPLAPCSRAMPRALWEVLGGWRFLMGEVPL